MSQHLINDFIHKNVVFKSFHGGRIINKKMVKYQASNRENNTSPEDVAESVIASNYVKEKVATNNQKDEKKSADEDLEHIDIIV